MRLLLVLLSLWSSAAPAQGTWFSVPANESQFSGYWRITLIPNDVHKRSMKNEQTGYSDPCQFFIHLPNGEWKNITITNMGGEAATKAKCPAKRSDLEPHIFAAGNGPYRWRKLSAQDGYFVVTDPQTGHWLLWKADFVVNDVPSSNPIGIELRKGDLVMELSRRVEGNRAVPIWPVILKPVSND